MSMSRDVYIVDAVRTPIGRGKADGALHGIHPVDLLAGTLNALVDRTGIDKAEVEDVVAGCVTPIQEQGACIGRLAALQTRLIIPPCLAGRNFFAGPH